MYTISRNLEEGHTVWWWLLIFWDRVFGPCCLYSTYERDAWRPTDYWLYDIKFKFTSDEPFLFAIFEPGLAAKKEKKNWGIKPKTTLVAKFCWACESTMSHCEILATPVQRGVGFYAKRQPSSAENCLSFNYSVSVKRTEIRHDLLLNNWEHELRLFRKWHCTLIFLSV